MLLYDRLLSFSLVVLVHAHIRTQAHSILIHIEGFRQRWKAETCSLSIDPTYTKLSVLCRCNCIGSCRLGLCVVYNLPPPPLHLTSPPLRLTCSVLIRPELFYSEPPSRLNFLSHPTPMGVLVFPLSLSLSLPRSLFLSL